MVNVAFNNLNTNIIWYISKNRKTMQHIKVFQKHLIICYLAFFLFGIKI